MGDELACRPEQDSGHFRDLRKRRKVRLSCAALFEAIRYLATAGVSVDDAVAELRELANGRGDLLAEQAGLMTGYAEVAPVTDAHRLAARLLVLAGADADALPRWIEIGRQRASAPMHSA